ncbi:MAG: aromatic amino acid transport family protein [Chlamydiota bacterium]
MQSSTKKIISASLLIAGTTIGAGMLGIPLVTGQIGFIPSTFVTLFVWIFMVITGLLFLEATLWMPKGANILSMTEKILGKKEKVLAGGTFLFLYYCLMIAYFAAGAPIFASFFQTVFGWTLSSWSSFAVFGLVFGSIVALGLHFVDKVNYILMVGLVFSYFALVGSGVSHVSLEKLRYTHYSPILLALPVLFSAFGYHNVIPSLTTHFEDKGKVMRQAILWGTLLPLVVYLIWQWLIIGILPQEVIQETMRKGSPVTDALLNLVGAKSIMVFGQSFAFFAIVTSFLGVAFSIVDFLGDGLGIQERTGFRRVGLTLLTFVPPFIFTAMNPSVFLIAIGIAGGFGEAFLNGILPAWLVWKGRYHKKLTSSFYIPGGKILLVAVLCIAIAVIGIEAFLLYRG